MSSRFSIRSFVVLIGLGFSALPAVAAPPSAAVLTDLVSGFRASGAVVKFDAIEPSASEDRVKVRGLSITVPTGSQAAAAGPRIVTIGSLDLSRFGKVTAGYAAGRVVATDVRLQSDGLSLVVTSLAFDSLNLPLQDWPELDTAKPTRSFVALVRAFARVAIGNLAVDGVRLAPLALPDTAAVTMDRLTLGGLASGRFDDLKIGRLQVPGAIAGSGLAVRDIAIKDLDLAALVLPFDQRTYVGGMADRLWSSLSTAMEIGALERTTAAGTLRTGRLTLAGLQVRPFKTSILNILDANAADPAYFAGNVAAARLAGAEMTDFITVQSLAAANLAFEATATGELQQLSCAGLDITELSLRRVQEAVARDCAVRATANRSAGFDELSVRNFSFDQIIDASTQPEAASPDLIPTVDRVALSGGYFKQGDSDIRLGSLTFDARAPIRGVPTVVAVVLDGLAFPVTGLADPALRGSLTGLGLQSVRLGAELRATWRDGPGEIDVETAAVTIQDLGRLGVSGTLTQVPLRALDAPFATTAQQLGLRRLKIVYDDASLVRRLLELIATNNKQSPDDIRKALSRNLPQILSAIPDSTARGKLTFATLGLLNNPGQTEISSNLAEDVPISKVWQTITTTPLLVPGLLKLDAVSRPRPASGG